MKEKKLRRKAIKKETKIRERNKEVTMKEFKMKDSEYEKKIWRR